MALAIIFDSVGFGEWFVLLAVILVVVGPRNLPSTARKIGNYYSRFRRAAESFKRQIMDMDTEFDRYMDETKKEVQEAFSVEPESDHQYDGLDYPHEETEDGVYNPETGEFEPRDDERERTPPADGNPEKDVNGDKAS